MCERLHDQDFLYRRENQTRSRDLGSLARRGGEYCSVAIWDVEIRFFALVVQAIIRGKPRFRRAESRRGAGFANNQLDINESMSMEVDGKSAVAHSRGHMHGVIHLRKKSFRFAVRNEQL